MAQLSDALMPVIAAVAVFLLLARLLAVPELDAARCALLGKLRHRD